MKIKHLKDTKNLRIRREYNYIYIYNNNYIDN